MTIRRKRKTSKRKAKRAKRLSPPTRIIKRRKGSKRPPQHSKLNSRRRKILFEALRLGMTRKAACAMAGISTSSFGDYMDYGRDPTLTKYHHFRNKVRRIEAERDAAALEVLKVAAEGGYKMKKTKIKYGGKDGYTFERTVSTLAPQWQAAAWYLERKNKNDWGRDKITLDKTPEEYAREIKEAHDLLMNSVPMSEA